MADKSPAHQQSKDGKSEGFNQTARSTASPRYHRDDQATAALSIGTEGFKDMDDLIQRLAKSNREGAPNNAT
jgi:hypothetical protein